MKIIDILNKIANGEEVPEIILFNGYKYKFNKTKNEYQRLRHDGMLGGTLGTINVLDRCLNDEVEIIEDTFSGIKFYENGKETCSIDTKPSFTTKDLHIEEDKKIEKIRELKTFPSIDDEEYAYEDGRRDKNVLIHNQIEKLFIDKINEIIDKINGDS